ncbi:hypothetical protein F4820DRAFT_467164 [Hypoxylon rubiginosum]|uniref:Uncharacterized protein n=1 Tax=Hypoxylon rubiginosum TaxID=110542 RepID=A0ACB9YIT7_9PEZI|nr:hypothetical protein F4820DRAFT_467164 [Hypoxylon rubiginosum]
MKSKSTLSILGLASLVRVSTSLQLNVTAISARDGSSIFQCWQMDTPFDISTEPGTLGTAGAVLGDVSTVSYTIIPANHDSGLHNAPCNLWAVVAGLVHFTLPDDDTAGAYISGGSSSIMFAADTAEVSQRGHNARFPGLTETIVLQIPTHDGEVPKHSVLHMGPCGVDDMVGIREVGLGATRSGPVEAKVEVDGNLLPIQFL